MSESKKSPTPLAVALLVALLCAIWGSTWIVIRGGLEVLPPFTAAAARFVIAALAMTLVTAALRHREGGGKPPTWLWIALGTLNFFGSYAIVYRTETLLPSGLVALLWGVFPMLSALAGHFFLRLFEIVAIGVDDCRHDGSRIIFVFAPNFDLKDVHE